MVIDAGKLERYPCQFLDNLVRIGNIHRDNPNHFWNALFMAFRPYRDLSYKDRAHYIQEERKRIAHSIKKEDWLRYGAGFQSDHLILEEFKKLFLDQEGHSNKLAPALSIVMRIVSDRSAMVTDLAVENCHDISPGTTKESVMEELRGRYLQVIDTIERKDGKKLSFEKKEKCLLYFQEYLDSLWQQASDKVFADFVATLKDPEECVSFYVVPLILSALDFNVFFVDTKGQDILSINDFYEENLRIEREECVLVLYDSKRQSYESMGVIDPNEEDVDQKTVCLTRVFDMDDPVAQICYKRVVESH